MTTLNPSQRQPGFSAGIQTGMSATSPSSRGLERITRKYISQLSWGNKSLWRSGYKGEELKKLVGSQLATTIQGLSPDGGFFLDKDGNPQLAVECKYQGAQGNAIERWFKNYLVMQSLGVQRYVTFCLGAGFFDGNSSERTMNLAMALIEPASKEVWEVPVGKVGFYRWRTLDEAEKSIPLVLARELAELYPEHYSVS